MANAEYPARILAHGLCAASFLGMAIAMAGAAACNGGAPVWMSPANHPSSWTAESWLFYTYYALAQRIPLDLATAFLLCLSSQPTWRVLAPTAAVSLGVVALWLATVITGSEVPGMVGAGLVVVAYTGVAVCAAVRLAQDQRLDHVLLMLFAICEAGTHGVYIGVGASILVLTPLRISRAVVVPFAATATTVVWGVRSLDDSVVARFWNKVVPMVLRCYACCLGMCGICYRACCGCDAAPRAREPHQWDYAEASDPLQMSMPLLHQPPSAASSGAVASLMPAPAQAPGGYRSPFTLAADAVPSGVTLLHPASAADSMAPLQREASAMSSEPLSSLWQEAGAVPAGWAALTAGSPMSDVHAAAVPSMSPGSGHTPINSHDDEGPAFWN